MDAQLLGCLASGATAMLVAFVRPRLRAWRRASRVRRKLGDPASAVSKVAPGGPAVLVGVLRSERAPSPGVPAATTTTPPGGEALEEAFAIAQTTAPAPLVLAVQDALVHVAGVQVVVGSRESTWPDARRARAVYHGDRVLAAGVLREAPGDEARQYRERSVALELEPAPNGFVTLVYAGVPRPLRFSLARYALAAVIGAGVWGALLSARHLTPPRVAGVGACSAPLDTQLDHGDPAAAATLAEACGDWLRAARGAWQAADFDRASRAFTSARSAAPIAPTLTEVGAHLLAGRFAESALAARDLAQRGDVLDLSHRTTLDCYADAMLARAGDAAARQLLSTRAETAQSPAACALLAADLASGTERKAVVDMRFRPQFPGRWERGGYGGLLMGPGDVDDYTFTLLDGESVRGKWSLRPPEWYPLQALRAPKGVILLRPLGLEITIGDRLENELEAEHKLTSATFASYVGDHAAAAKELHNALILTGLEGVRWDRDANRTDAFAYAPPSGGEPPAAFEARKLAHRRFFFLGAILAARAKEIENARVLLSMAPEESNGAAELAPFLDLLANDGPHRDALATIVRKETWEPNRDLWSVVASGDGGAMVRQLRAGKFDGRGVLPFVTALGGVADAVRPYVVHEYPPPCWTCGPHVLLDWIAGRREVAQGVGASELDEGLAPVAQRLHAAFVRRDISIPLYVLGRVAPL